MRKKHKLIYTSRSNKNILEAFEYYESAQKTWEIIFSFFIRKLH